MGERACLSHKTDGVERERKSALRSLPVFVLHLLVELLSNGAVGTICPDKNITRKGNSLSAFDADAVVILPIDAIFVAMWSLSLENCCESRSYSRGRGIDKPGRAKSTNVAKDDVVK